MNSNEPCTESALREELVRACKVLYATKAAGDGLGGHLSARLDGRRILIKPRPVSWHRLVAEDLIVIDFEGKRVDAARGWTIRGSRMADPRANLRGAAGYRLRSTRPPCGFDPDGRAGHCRGTAGSGLRGIRGPVAGVEQWRREHFDAGAGRWSGYGGSVS